MRRYEHVPVLADECLSLLQIKRGGVYVDGTVGGAGHALRILEMLGGDGATLIGVDRDKTAAEVSAERLENRNRELGRGVRCEVVKSNFTNIDKICENFGITGVDGVLLDLGVSSEMLDDSERGFSFKQEAPLDMRMDKEAEVSAADIVNNRPERELADIILRYGEERWAARIAKFIVERRARKPVETTGELADIICAAIPKGARRGGPHPARRAFMAIRIAVNDELGAIAVTIRKAAVLLKNRGRICVISFHSLEDRIVKKTIEELSTGCVCPKDFPICVCGNAATLRKVTRKPAVPTEAEITLNARARSAKLRVAEKI